MTVPVADVPSIPRAEQLHLYYVRLASAARGYRTGGFVLESLSIALALSTFPGHFGLWVYLLVALAAFAAGACHLAAEKRYALARWCRKTSLWAYAHRADVTDEHSQRAHREIETSGILRKARMEHSDQVERLDPYYQARGMAPTFRLQECYAHSSYYTWRLLRRHSQTLWTITVIVAVAFIGVPFFSAQLAAHEHALEALYVLIFGYFFQKLARAALATARQATEIGDIHVRLLGKGLAADRVIDIVFEYETARSAGADPPSWLYRFLLTDLHSGWEQERASLRE